MTNELLQAALRYAGRGLPVFPCERRGKRPRTANGLLDASTDAGQIERWWRANGNANVAVVTGPASGLLVIDVDGDDGAEALRGLEREHGPLPRTTSVVTPRGGAHYYLRYPTGRGEIRNSAGLLGPGLDVRGAGGYVLMPPSQGANGRRYEPDERAPLAEPPGWLLQRLSGPQNGSRRTPASEWVAIARDGLTEGQRNQGLTRLVGHLLAKDVDARLVLELAQLVNQRCRPPLAPSDVERIVESIAGRELRKRRIGAPR